MTLLCWEEGEFPASMQEGIIKLLPKENSANRGDLKTISLPGDISLDVAALADDTAVFLEVHHDSFQAFQSLLDCFQSASGAKVNYKKSKILILGKYSTPPNWLANGPFLVLGRCQAARDLGVMVASNLKPQDAWAHTLASISAHLQSLSDRNLSFESRTTVLRFLIQTKLSFPVSLVRLRNSQVKTLRQLLRSLLWGLGPTDKSKTPLVSWDYLALPTSEGGLGVWDFHNFGLAFIAKYVGSLLTDPPDASWPCLFWSLCRDDIRRTKEEFLLLATSPSTQGLLFFARMIRTWDDFRLSLELRSLSFSFGGGTWSVPLLADSFLEGS
ncbi:hypothetical protein R1sor_010225 [Riccia sorocarpa]|uniref:Reverse transcriptase domain-containing protein n=1 Tax=Riccia sorocarpa TaxID=122646 RepID=A0ABD3I0S4_9MARC